MDIKYYFKLYTKDHGFIDELYIFSGVEYTKTLNGIENMTFNIPINYLSQKEIEWLNNYHQNVNNVITNAATSLTEDEITWLNKATAAI